MLRRPVWMIVCLLWVVPSLAATHVEWLTLDGAIGPVAYKMIGEALHRAEQSGAEALVIELDTPGGLLSSTRIICKDLLAAKVAVVVYVAPSGARAGSAGVFITLAAHVAVMAPGTNIGAAHPVGIGGFGGGDTSKVMSDKATNDAAAFARTLAEQHGRNVDWAERSVRESISATESEALELGVIDGIISSRDSLLTFMDGRVVILSGQSDTLHTVNADIHETPIGLRLKILSLLADPNIAYIFLLLGIYGLFFELYNPGAILPGVVGSLSLILAFFSLHLLPLNWAGLLLIILSVVLFLLEIKVASYGLLSIGGVISMFIGSLMLFEPFKTGIHVNLEMIILASIVTALFFIFVVGMGIRAQRRRVTTGQEGLIGEIGTVAVRLAPRGKVQVHGEWWDAACSTTMEVGARVRVVAIQGMLLTVKPADSPETSAK
ncbi:MAG: nodulation protein NfeD [bacterium]|nr:nodulation protein NfeD [bacterium]